MSNWWDADGVTGAAPKDFWLTDAPADKSEKWRKVGEEMGPVAKRVLSAIQGPTFGFGDEIVGGLGAVASRLGSGPASEVPFPEAYRGMRDIARGAAESFQKSNPWEAGATQVAASLPYGGFLKPIANAPVGGALAKALLTGGVGGAIAGAGNAREMGDVPMDAAFGALTGAVMGGGVQGVQSGANAIYNTIAPRVSQASALSIAQKRIAEALARDRVPTTQAAQMMDKLGPEARLADAAGVNTRTLLDTAATLPGITKDKVEQAIRDRQSGRFGRLTGEAEQLMNVGTRRLPQTLEELDKFRQKTAGPLYDKVRQTNVQVDDELAQLLERARPAFAEASALAKVKGEPFVMGDKLADSMPLSQLDTLKRSLHDKAYSSANVNPETGRLNESGRAWNTLRKQLVDKLDALTTDKSGQSIYKAARDAYAGPTELRNAANLGSQAMSKDAWKISEITKDMSESELQAFRVGAMEAIRTKLGTEGGQTNMLKFWKEPNTSQKLKELFPTPRLFQEFADTLTNEGKLKAFESIGRGSQTAARQAALDELSGSTATELGAAVRDVATHNPGRMMMRAKEIYGRAATPEPVRNEIGNILLSQGKDAGMNLGQMKALAELLRQRQDSQAYGAGALSSQLARMLSAQ